MKTWKILVSAFFQIGIAIGIGVLLLSVVYSIPTERIEKNVRRSALDTIREEGEYPELTHIATSYLDNWTDSIMLINAAHPTGDSPFVDAMLVPRYVADSFPNKSLVLWAESGEYRYEGTYPQYWHGYLVVLKPLLTVMDYAGIRLLNGISQTILVLIVSILFWLRGKKGYILPWLISYGMLMPFALAKSLQYSSCFYIFTIASIVLLCQKKPRDPFYIFLWAGIATAYFDFLTYPISTFGVPAVVYLILHRQMNLKKSVAQLAACFLCWAAGYGLMWGGKLLAGSLITGTDFIFEAENHLSQWFDGDRWFSIGYVFYFNVRDFVYTPVSFIALGFAIFTTIKIIKGKKTTIDNLLFCVPYIVVLLLPFLWYLFLFNPSGIHHFFTNKACVVCAFGGMSMLTMLAGSNINSIDSSILAH